MTSRCRWPGCAAQVESRYACIDHWQLLPRELRQGIYRSYNPTKLHQSDEYQAAHKAILKWAADQGLIEEPKLAPAPAPETGQLFDEPAPVADEPDPVAHIRHMPIAEQMKYTQARYVWPRRTLLQPNKTPDGGRETWLQWWERRHKQLLSEYVAYCQANYENPARSTAGV